MGSVRVDATCKLAAVEQESSWSAYRIHSLSKCVEILRSLSSMPIMRSTFCKSERPGHAGVKALPRLWQ